jgi:enoyl-CoA hydratase/carnithine racemase
LDSLANLDKLLTKIEAHISLKGLIVATPGATMPTRLAPALQAQEIDRESWRMLTGRVARSFLRIARMPWNTVAAIGGPCTGMALELALACKVRIGVTAESCVLGFPELVSGKMPSFGGTQYLPRILGFTRAAEWLALGKPATAAEALEIGLLDAVVPPRELNAATLACAEGRGKLKPRPAQSWFSDQTWLGRRRAAGKITRTLAGDPGARPRILAIEAARDGVALPLVKALDLEAQRSAALHSNHEA